MKMNERIQRTPINSLNKLHSTHSNQRFLVRKIKSIYEQYDIAVPTKVQIFTFNEKSNSRNKKFAESKKM